MKIHVIPAWIVRNLSYVEIVYDENTALDLRDRGYAVTYEPQERVCVKDRTLNPEISCYMCLRRVSSYYKGTKQDES